MHRTLKPEELLAGLPQGRDAEPLAGRLRTLLERAWTPCWHKVVNKKPRRHQPKAKQAGAHTSVHKVLLQAKRQQDQPTPSRSP